MNVDNFPTTPEEDFAFAQLEQKLMTTPTIPTLPADYIPLVETSSTIINSHTGAQYQPMNTSPNQQPDPQHIVNQIAALLSQLVSVINTTQTKPEPTTDLADTIDTVLQYADWLPSMIEEHVAEHIGTAEITNMVEEAVKTCLADSLSDDIDHYMNHNFNIERHVNIAERVRDVLDDTLDDAVASALDNKLEDALTDLLSDKIITINI